MDESDGNQQEHITIFSDETRRRSSIHLTSRWPPRLAQALRSRLFNLTLAFTLQSITLLLQYAKERLAAAPFVAFRACFRPSAWLSRSSALFGATVARCVREQYMTNPGIHEPGFSRMGHGQHALLISKV
jgi:hypothetical protein